MIYGDISGIKKSILNHLEEINNYHIHAGAVLDGELVGFLLNSTEKINSEIVIVIDKNNNVIAVAVGNCKEASIPYIDKRMRKRGLNGLKMFHTHPSGSSYLSRADRSSLLELKFDIIGAIAKGKSGEALINIGLLNVNDNSLTIDEYGPLSLNELNKFDYSLQNSIVNSYLRDNVDYDNSQVEKAILVGVDVKSEDMILDIDYSMKELEELAITVGAITVGSVVQRRTRIDKTFYLGKGKLEELRIRIQNEKANLIICNDELNATQLKVMETFLGVKVIDRTSLILEIFARHANSSEGKLQVELAMLKYRLPRLHGMGKVLSRTGGGIGTRGPGEKKLETDRRAIYREINALEKKVSAINRIRDEQKRRRISFDIPIVSLVGYTNAGKSTLFNLLTDSSTISQDKLFATLDSTTRKIKTLENVLLTDTVGFIDKLPHELVKAFKSTLEGVADSSLLLHVIDSSNANFTRQVDVVNQVLKSLKCENKKVIYVFNKIDKRCHDFDLKASTIKGIKVTTSAKYDLGIHELVEKIESAVYSQATTKELLIPYSEVKRLNYLHNKGVVQRETYESDGIRVTIRSQD